MVAARRPVTVFVSDVNSLRAAVEADESVASSLHTVVGRDLAAKLRSRNKAME